MKNIGLQRNRFFRGCKITFPSSMRAATLFLFLAIGAIAVVSANGIPDELRPLQCDRLFYNPVTDQSYPTCVLKKQLFRGEFQTFNQFVSPNTPIRRIKFSDMSTVQDLGTWSTEYNFVTRQKSLGDPSALLSDDLDYPCFFFAHTDGATYTDSQGGAWSHEKPAVAASGLVAKKTKIRMPDSSVLEFVMRPVHIGFSTTLFDNPPASARAAEDDIVYATTTRIYQKASSETIWEVFPALTHGNQSGAIFCQDVAAQCASVWGGNGATSACLQHFDQFRIMDLDGMPRSSGNSVLCRLYHFFQSQNSDCSTLSASYQQCRD
ncbi:MAG TPA: hypothetical protein VKE92_10895 [Anaerolineales bacterium]|nr:hypothetical protein [Anaerolineales bacterium]